MSTPPQPPNVCRADGSIDPEHLLAWIGSRSPASTIAIAQRLQLPTEALRLVLGQLEDAGRLVRLDGRWQLDVTAPPLQLEHHTPQASAGELPEISSEAQRALLIQIAVHPGASRSQLAKLADVPRNTVSSAVSRLRRIGVVAPSGEPLQLTDLGVRWLRTVSKSPTLEADRSPRGSRDTPRAPAPQAAPAERRAELWERIQRWSLKTRGLSVHELEALLADLAPLLVGAP